MAKATVSKQPQADTGSTDAGENGRMFMLATFVLLIVTTLLRLRMVNVPFERDEGEYAYMGKLILDGVMPYKEAYSMKLPGTALMYAVILGVFGKSVSAVHIGFAIINAATVLFLFTGIKKMFNPAVAFTTAATYALLSLSPSTLGFAAHATQVVSFFVSVALWCYSQYRTEMKIVWALLAGLSTGMAFLAKQQAVFFIVFGLVIFGANVVKRKGGAPNLFLYLTGTILPLLLTLLMVYSSGSWEKFKFWTYTYASQYASGVSFDRGVELFTQSFGPMFKEYFLLWLLAIMGLVVLLRAEIYKQHRLFVLTLFVASFLSICPGFYFRSHYFISLLPAVGLLAGIALDYFVQLKWKGKNQLVLPVAIIGLSLLLAVAQNAGYYIEDDGETISENIYGINPFVESVEIAEYLKAHSKQTDKIAVVGSEPQVYFYSDRKAATGYIYTYGLMELHPYNKKMQQEMMSEIKAAKPEYLVLFKVGLSWLAKPESPQDIFSWFFGYTKEMYDLVGAGDVHPEATTSFVWGEATQLYVPKSEDFILIFKRRG